MKRGCFLSSPNKSTAYCRFASSASGLNFSLQQQSSAAVATRRGVQAEEQQRPLRRRRAMCEVCGVTVASLAAAAASKLYTSHIYTPALSDHIYMVKHER